MSEENSSIDSGSEENNPNSPFSENQNLEMSSKITQKLTVLQGKKETLFLRIQRLYDDAQNINDPQRKDYFLVRIKTLDQTISEFNQLVEDIALLKLQLDPTDSVSYQELTVVDDMKAYIISVGDNLKISNKNGNVSKQENKVSGPTQSITKSRVKLPRLDLPAFNGDPNLWNIFYEAFQYLHNSTELTTAEKLRYLLGKLSGKALALVSGFQPTEINYPIIWSTLVDRYQDKRTLGNHYLNQILTFKALEKESGPALEEFTRRVLSSYEALKNLDIPNIADFIFLHIALSKLDTATLKAFEMLERNNEIPTINSLNQFIKDQIKVLNRNLKGEKITPKKYQSFAITNSNKRDQFYCPLHKNGHHDLFHCRTFKSYPVFKRKELVQTHNLCTLCLKGGHSGLICKANINCFKCSERHNTLLHSYVAKTSDSVTSQELQKSETQNSTTAPKVTMHCHTNNQSKKGLVILSTALVKVYDCDGKSHLVRALLDTASQADFVTEKLIQKLSLSTQTTTSAVSGIGAIHKSVSLKTNLSFASRYDDSIRYSLQPFVVDNITENLPSQEILSDYLEEFVDLPLADTPYDKLERIDMLLGANIFPLMLEQDQRVSREYPLIALKTKLGYVVLGKIPTLVSNTVSVNVSIHSNEDGDLQEQVHKFWELEQIPEQDPELEMSSINLAGEDKICEEAFINTVRRESDGRFIVSLPFKQPLHTLGSSYQIAKKRFLMLESRFQSNPSLKKEYISAIQDYISQKHMSLLGFPKDDYYMPHFPVIKLDRASTKVRIVFDASQKDMNNLSLNDILYTGPKLQIDLTSILIGFRIYPVAITADIKQMYRQINIHPEHRQAQKILWRFEPEDELQAWTLNTVTFGVRPAPFLALRVIKEITKEHERAFPLASVVSSRDMFIDDLVTSVENSSVAIKLYHELIDLFNKAKFELVKWSSNSAELMNHIPSKFHFPEVVEFNDNKNMKVLGLQWHSISDQFSFKINTVNQPLTKRTALSTLARIFDPLGILAPVTIKLKFIIQKIWKEKLNWDDSVPKALCQEWFKLTEQLWMLKDIKVKRYLHITPSSLVDVIGFTDASEVGLGSVVYIRVEQPDGHVHVNLLCAKSKVTPLKKITIPRLELEAAVLLAKLINFVKNCLQSRVVVRSFHTYSDSEIVLHWIRNESVKLKQYVLNRVNLIKKFTSFSTWAHVPSKQNPADLISRGMLPSQLNKNTLWFEGPSWIGYSLNSWPQFTPNNIIELSPDVSINLIVTHHIHPLRQLIDKFSDYKRLLRVTVYVLRFIKKVKAESTLMTTQNFNLAEIELVKCVQGTHFKTEIDALLQNKNYSLKIKKLNPFMWDGVLRVGGRLANSDLSYDQKFPILLPKNDNFIKLVIENIHKTNLHTGPRLVLSLFKSKFWLIDGKRIIQNILEKCNHCFKLNPKSSIPLMGNLPACRVKPTKAFLETGVDYAGPFRIVFNKYRKNNSQKAYVCIFICMSTKAVHLELVSDLTTQAFMAAFRRFISRRGPCQYIYSDCGTNFQGASNELKRLYKLLQDRGFQEVIENEFSSYKIHWVFNPPLSANFGGLWESNIKSMKIHLKKAIGENLLTYEDFNTVLVQIEAILNSRPLTDHSVDPSDPTPLTPSHFLMQHTLPDILTEPTSNIPTNRLSRYQLLNKLVQSFWRRWHSEYLTELQTRDKWYNNSANIKLGTVVLVREDNSPPLRWPLGVVVHLHPGTDGIIRVVTIRTANGNTYKRSVTRLCPLPSQ